MKYIVLLLCYSVHAMETIPVTKQLFHALEKSYVGKHATVQELEELIEQGADVSAKTGDRTPLFMACMYNNLKAAHLLLNYNASTEGCLAVMVNKGKLEFCKLLLDKGADPSAQDNFKETPLHFALNNGFHELAELLIERGADVFLQDLFGVTPLHYAARTDNLELIGLLLQKGADVNAISKKGETPLFEAARAGHVETILFLLAKKADVYRKNTDDETPGDLVEDYACLRICKELLDYMYEEKREQETLIY